MAAAGRNARPPGATPLKRLAPPQTAIPGTKPSGIMAAIPPIAARIPTASRIRTPAPNMVVVPAHAKSAS